MVSSDPIRFVSTEVIDTQPFNYLCPLFVVAAIFDSRLLEKVFACPIPYDLEQADDRDQDQAPAARRLQISWAFHLYELFEELYPKPGLTRAQIVATAEVRQPMSRGVSLTSSRTGSRPLPLMTLLPEFAPAN